MAKGLNLISGIYVIVDVARSHLAQGLLAAGATVVQLRDKEVSASELLEAGRKLKHVTSDAGALLIINDRVDVAIASEADGVHIGQDDLPIEDVHAALTAAGQNMIVGLSTHTEEQALDAASRGADYIGFGPIYGTATKANPDPITGVDVLSQLRLLVSVPIVAIGGINQENLGPVAASGVDAACVISAILESHEPEAALKALHDSWMTHK